MGAESSSLAHPFSIQPLPSLASGEPWGHPSSHMAAQWSCPFAAALVLRGQRTVPLSWNPSLSGSAPRFCNGVQLNYSHTCLCLGVCPFSVCEDFTPVPLSEVLRRPPTSCLTFGPSPAAHLNPQPPGVGGNPGP